MKAFAVVAVAVALFAATAAAQTIYGPCTTAAGAPGDCMEPAFCKTRAGTVSGRCGGTTPKCCVRDAVVAPVTPTTPTTPSTPVAPAALKSCTDFIGNPGFCRPASQCTTSTVSGRCPGTAADVKCCLVPSPLPANAAAAAGQTMYFVLRSQAFPNNGFPGAVVYVPAAYRNSGPLNVVVFIHGHWNCISNVIRPAGQGVACSANQPARYPYRLIEQIENSGKNVLLVVIETARDVASGAPGQVGNRNGLRNVLHELLNEKLAPVFGARSVDSISRTIVFGHSAAFESTSAFAVQSGVPSLREIHLLDSLYGYADRYMQWISSNKAGFLSGNFKFSNIYFSSTAKRSVQQAKDVKAVFPAGSAAYVWEDKGVVSDDALWRTAVVFKASNVKSHDGIPATFVEKILAASPI